MRAISPALLSALCLVCTAGFARADRIILAPGGNNLAPNDFKTEFTISPQSRDSNFEWLQYSSPDGIEMEMERTDLTGETRKGYAFNLQYPIVPDFGRRVAASVGVRDLLGTGQEHGALYAVLAHPVPLSDRQYRMTRALELDAGMGTGWLSGPFAGIETRLAAGPLVRAELLRNRVNLALGMPVMKGIKFQATSLNGTLYYGFALAWTR